MCTCSFRPSCIHLDVLAHSIALRGQFLFSRLESPVIQFTLNHLGSGHCHSDTPSRCTHPNNLSSFPQSKKPLSPLTSLFSLMGTFGQYFCLRTAVSSSGAIRGATIKKASCPDHRPLSSVMAKINAS